MIPAMRDVGDKFSRNEVYVPEMLIAARAMQAGLDIIEPILVAADGPGYPCSYRGRWQPMDQVNSPGYTT
jgi:hypothetical protein